MKILAADAIKLKFHGCSFLVASSSNTSDTPDVLVTRMLRGNCLR